MEILVILIVLLIFLGLSARAERDSSGGAHGAKPARKPIGRGALDPAGAGRNEAVKHSPIERSTGAGSDSERPGAGLSFCCANPLVMLVMLPFFSFLLESTKEEVRKILEKKLIRCLSSEAGTCPVCLEAVGLFPHECPSCGAMHHRECWDWAGGCAVYGCASSCGSRPAFEIRRETGIASAQSNEASIRGTSKPANVLIKGVRMDGTFLEMEGLKLRFDDPDWSAKAAEYIAKAGRNPKYR